MKLEFLFVPTSDLGASLGLYRDALGFTEVWREGDATVALALPGSDVQLMLDSHDPDAPIGPLFVVDSVEAFHAARPRRCRSARRDPRRLHGHLPGAGRGNRLRHGPGDGLRDRVTRA
jgi:catechol 2,3-dioxygenase-like lactoylglutathione lyase family enzyme